MQLNEKDAAFACAAWVSGTDVVTISGWFEGLSRLSMGIEMGSFLGKYRSTEIQVESEIFRNNAIGDSLETERRGLVRNALRNFIITRSKYGMVELP